MASVSTQRSSAREGCADPAHQRRTRAGGIGSLGSDAERALGHAPTAWGLAVLAIKGQRDILSDDVIAHERRKSSARRRSRPIVCPAHPMLNGSAFTFAWRQSRRVPLDQCKGSKNAEGGSWRADSLMWPLQKRARSRNCSSGRPSSRARTTSRAAVEKAARCQVRRVLENRSGVKPRQRIAQAGEAPRADECLPLVRWVDAKLYRMSDATPP